MADAPAFIATPRIGAVTVSTANTARDGTGTIATVFTAGANGSRIEEVVLKATGDPADSIVTLFLHDGSTYFLFDEVDLADPAAASTTVTGYRMSRTYDNLVLPTGWSLRAAITVALSSGVINAIALGGDF
jgi:hypothetical protein